MAKKIISIIAVFALVILLGSTSNAGEIYTAEARGHYENPVNSQVEDAGNNPEIGEGMVSNSVYALALIEKDDNGKLYATVRYKLRDQISNVRMWVQNKGSESFTEVPVEETKNAGKTGDFRFEIPSTDALIKSSFFVEPMGRDVVFFVTLGNLQEGNTDFKTYVSASDKNPEGDSSSGGGDISNNGSQSSGGTENNKGNRASANTKKQLSSSRKGTKNSNSVNKSRPSELSGENKEKCSRGKNSFGFSHGLLTNKDFGDDVSEKDKKETKHPLGPVSKAFLILLTVIAGILFSAAIIGAAAIFILYRNVKNKNTAMEKSVETMEENRHFSDIAKLYKRRNKNSEHLKKKPRKVEKPHEENSAAENSESIWDRHPGFYEEEKVNE